MNDQLGERMKRYEAVTRSVLLPHSFTILRVDGRAFHTYLRHAEKPYDYGFIRDMQAVGKAMCREISGTVFAYGQSDEISLVLSDVESQMQPWFGGVVQKMASVAASMATAFLIFRRGVDDLPQFDARVFTVPSWTEAANYFIWRQRDAVRNSISMAAQAKWSPKQLEHVPTSQLQELLWAHHKINWNDYPETARRGWVLTKEVRKTDVTYTEKRSGEEVNTVAERTFWETTSPHLTIDSPLFDLLLSGTSVH